MNYKKIVLDAFVSIYNKKYSKIRGSVLYEAKKYCPERSFEAQQLKI